MFSNEGHVREALGAMNSGSGGLEDRLQKLAMLGRFPNESTKLAVSYSAARAFTDCESVACSLMQVRTRMTAATVESIPK